MKTILSDFVITIIYLLELLIFIRVILSFAVFFSPRLLYSNHPVINFLNSVTDPLLNPFKNILPTTRLGLDLSPLFALFVLEIFKILILTIIDKLF